MRFVARCLGVISHRRLATLAKAFKDGPGNRIGHCLYASACARRLPSVLVTDVEGGRLRVRVFSSAAAVEIKLGPCGLPEHLCTRDGPTLRELAWFSRQAYADVKPGAQPPTSKGWLLDVEHSRSVPTEGVHMQTWRRGNDIVVAMRGSTPDEIAHFLGNLGLLRARLEADSMGPLAEIVRGIDSIVGCWGVKGLQGADVARRLLHDLLDSIDPKVDNVTKDRAPLSAPLTPDPHHRNSFLRVWITGHSRGAALAQYAALPHVSKFGRLHAIVGFEGPGLPAALVDCEDMPCRQKFVDFFTYPNAITVLHPSVNLKQRYHIPIKLPGHGNSLQFIGRCVVADANRVANWVTLMLPCARGASAVALAASAEAVTWQVAAATAVSAKLFQALSSTEHMLCGVSAVMSVTGASKVQRLAILGSLALVAEDMQLSHSMDGILERVLESDGLGVIRQIQTWPSDDAHFSTKRAFDIMLTAVVDFGRDQLVFNQPDLLGIHQLLLGNGGAQMLWEHRMRRTWDGHWLLGEAQS